jgi:thiol:disulfide interchange protein DsbD
MLAAALLIAQADATPNSQAQILSSVRQAAPGKPFAVAVRIALDPQWHTYWSNPGDSGSATTVDWKLPKGWRVSAPRFPAPHRILTGEIVSYGYENQATILFTVTPPANAKTGTLIADAQWLVCQETCVPAQAKLSLRVPVGAKVRPGADLAKYEADVPRPAGRDYTFAAWPTKTGYGLRVLNSKGSLPGESAYFYPLEPGVLNHGAPQAFRPVSAGAEADLAKSPYASAAAKRLRGVLVVSEGGPALLVDVPVTKENPDR